MAIIDNFRGQLTEKIVKELEDNNIQSVLVPANCTDRLQPMDLSVNKSAKAFMRSQFAMWYAEEMLLLHQTANTTSNISLTSRLRMTVVVMKLNTVVKLMRMSRLGGKILLTQMRIYRPLLQKIKEK